MSDVSSSEEAFFLVCKYLLTMNPPESILNPIQIVKGVPGFIVTLYQIAGQNRMCVIISHILFLLFGWIPKEGDSPSWPEESKETRGFVAGNPTGTASPWHTTLLAKSSVLYLCEGAGSGRLVLPTGMEAKEDGRELELRSDYSGRRQPGPAPEQRDTVLPPRISAPII